MDHFGIGLAMKGMALAFSNSSRRTGRTTSLVESVKDGDRICFANPQEAQRVAILCRKRGVNVQCIVIPPSDPVKIFERDRSTGRTLFDHGWIEQFYINAMDRCQLDIDSLQRSASGRDAAGTMSPEYLEHRWS